MVSNLNMQWDATVRTLNATVCERYDREAKRKLVLLELEVGFLIDEYIIEKVTLLKSLLMKR